MLLTPAQLKLKSFESRRTSLFFTRGGCASWRKVPESGARSVTPSIAFWHLPPNSARFSYATEGALFISTQLSTDADSALRKVRVLIRLWKQPSAKERTYT